MHGGIAQLGERLNGIQELGDLQLFIQGEECCVYACL